MSKLEEIPLKNILEIKKNQIKSVFFIKRIKLNVTNLIALFSLL